MSYSISRLAVVIVNRNSGDMLTACLDHVYGSRLKSQPLVIVVDNGSSDDSVRAASAKYPQIEVILGEKNLGFAAAVNLAIPLFRHAAFVLLVNTDAFLEPECAQKLMDLMDLQPEIGMAGPLFLNADGTPQTSFEAIPTLTTETLNRSLLKKLFPSRYPSKSTKFLFPTAVEALIGAVIMIRVQTLLQMGGFDEDYFFFLEETDLALRMRRGGWKVYHHPDAKAIHLQGATAKKMEIESRIEFNRSRYIFFLKHYGAFRTGVLKIVQIGNLTLNVVFLGCMALVTFGKVKPITHRLKVKYGLWVWHLRGCPKGKGLPRH